MAKGRTNQPIKVEVYAGWANHPAVDELRAAGHTVVVIESDANVILHSSAHGWDEALFAQGTRKNGTVYRPFVDAALADGRRKKRGAK